MRCTGSGGWRSIRKRSCLEGGECLVVMVLLLDDLQHVSLTTPDDRVQCNALNHYSTSANAETCL